jgi:dihydrofolate reductase
VIVPGQGSIGKEEKQMSSTVLYMSMSLDGFVAGPNERPDNGLGDGGGRLHEWFWSGAPTEHSDVPGRPAGVNGEIMDALASTGAVVAGRGTVEPAGYWDGDHHDGVPIFILSRHKSDADAAQWPLVTYVSDITTAMARAKEAAGEKDVLVHGVGTAQLALAAGVLDELQIHLIPVLLGEGRRLFEHLGADHIELEPMRIVDGPGVTHLRYRVCRQ